MNARVRVLPPNSKRGLFVACVAIGLVHGLIGAWAVAALGEWIVGFRGPTSTYGIIRTFFGVAVAFQLPALPVAMLFCRVHPKVGRLLVCGAIYGGSCFAGILAVVVANNPETLLTPWEPRPEGILGMLLGVAFFFVFGLVVVAAIFVGVFGLAIAIERFFGKRVVEQTGLVCWACGYNLGSPSISLCPECGRAFDPLARPRASSPQILSMLVLTRGPLIALGLLAAIVPVVLQLSTHTIPSVRFLRACSANATLQQTGMMGNYVMRTNSTNGSARVVMPISYGWWISDADSEKTGFAVQFVPKAAGGEPRMFVSRACLVDFNVPAAAVIAGPIPKYELVAPGTTRVVAKLSPEQARSIVDAGVVPAGLMDALRREAEKVGWKTVDPMVTPASAEHAVDATPFFPAMAPADANRPVP